MVPVGLYDLEDTVTRVRDVVVSVVGVAKRLTTPPPPPVEPEDPSDASTKNIRFLHYLGIGMSESPAQVRVPSDTQVYWKMPSSPTGLSQLWAPRIEGMPYRPWWASVVEKYQASRMPETASPLAASALRVVGPYKNAAVVYLPGFLNFGPTDEWMTTLSRQFGHGGAIIGVGQYGSVRHGQGYAVYGSEEPVLQPDWTLEVPMVIYRLSRALEDSANLRQADHLVVVGYSKGSLLSHALKALTLLYDYQKNDGTFNSQAYNVFPGLKNLSPDRVIRVMGALQPSEFHMLAPPIEGVPAESPAVRAVSALFLRQSAAFYSEDFFDSYFAKLGFGPEIIDSIIQVRSPKTLKDSLARERWGDGPWGRAFLKGGVRLGFRFGVGPLMGARNGDEIVRPVSTEYANLLELEVRDNHLGIVAGNDVALELGQVLMMSHASMRFFADSLQLDLRLTKRQDVARTISSRMRILGMRNPYPALLQEMETVSGILRIAGVPQEIENSVLMRIVYDRVYSPPEVGVRPLIDVVKESMEPTPRLNHVLFVGRRGLVDAERTLRGAHTPQSMLVESGHLMMAAPPMRMGHVDLVQSGNVLLQPAPAQVADESEPPCGDLFRKMPQLRQRIVVAQEMLTNAKPFPYREALIAKFNEILTVITRREMNRLIIEIQDHDISPEGIIKSVAHLYFEGKDALQGWQSVVPKRHAMPPGMAPANTTPLFGPKPVPAAAPPAIFH